jgi:hypothetical protein
MLHDGEILWVLALDGQSPRVIIKVSFPVLELPRAEKDFVAVAFLKEKGAFIRARRRRARRKSSGDGS